MSADLCCILKVSVRCGACKMKVMEILSSITGVYSVNIDATEGKVSVYGEVDPYLLMRALVNSGRHAELVWAKIKHPVLNRSYYDGGYLSNSYGYGLPCCGSFNQPSGQRRFMNDPRYLYGSASARSMAGYPPSAYEPCYDDPHNACSIM